VRSFLTTLYANHHPFARFGPANQVTLLRGLLVVVLAVLLLMPRSAALAAFTVGIGAFAAVLDAVDGPLARRTRMVSAFGARFDMEVDALLIQVLAVFAWRYDKAGAWVLLAGLFRYAFVVSGWIWPWLRRPLTPTLRAKTVCVVQTIALLVVLAPSIRRSVSGPIAAASLLLLAASFAADIGRLWRQRSGPQLPEHPWRRWAILAAALVILDASVTFVNIWPTPAFVWTGKLSIELGAVLLLLCATVAWKGALSRRVIGSVSAIWLLLVFARYVAVTAPALYGRDINLYWDFRFIPDVAAMVIRVAPFWLIGGVAVVALASILLLHRLMAWAFATVIDGLTVTAARRAIAAGACAVFVIFGAERLRPAEPEERIAPAPVTQTYLHQAALVLEARSGSRSVPASPAIESSFDGVRGADVFLVFLESYGAIADDPRFAHRLAPARLQLEADIRSSGREVVTTSVESPTFGGSSWLAHISLISGIEVRDPDTNALLMTQPRDTLVKAFSRAGFRTVGLMPGLRQQWPEGRFYGFDDIYGADQLAYTGPEFGWFAVPDQFSLARFDELERNRSDRPRFVFFPTISTHFPFSPTPPYQADWARMLTAKPYDGPEIVHAYAGEPDWADFSPGYVAAMSYDFAVVGGYLRRHTGRDLVMILIGDHQPPAAVSGEHATWNVPVHVITSRGPVIDRLLEAGFHAGLGPADHALTRMHALLPVLLRGFGT
jgi:phosphatidylglycerophosphate synthase